MTHTHLLDNELDMIDEEEAMPHRPMNHNKYHSTSAAVHQRAATTIFYSSDGNHSEVKEI